jgi:hypothetical protein
MQALLGEVQSAITARSGMDELKVRNTEVVSKFVSDRELRQSLDDDAFEFVQKAIIDVLLTEAAKGTVTVNDVPFKSPDALGMIKAIRNGARTEAILSFAIQDAAIAAMLPLFGLAASLYVSGPSWKDALDVAGIMHTMWSKFSVLRRPQDEDAIDTLDALIRVQGRLRTVTEHRHPDTSALTIELEKNGGEVVAALRKLHEKSVVEVVQWGGQSGDFSNLGTRWSLRF